MEVEDGRPDAHFYQALGRAIKVLRTERGLNRREVAEDSEVSYPYLSEIENGRKKPSSRALLAISEALGVRPHEVLETAERIAGGSWSGSSSQSDNPVTDHDGRAPSAVSEHRSTSLEELLRLVGTLPDNDLKRILDLARRLAS
jgi:transcriptional regulator with XRE-family HTH domain